MGSRISPFKSSNVKCSGLVGVYFVNMGLRPLQNDLIACCTDFMQLYTDR